MSICKISSIEKGFFYIFQNENKYYCVVRVIYKCNFTFVETVSFLYIMVLIRISQRGNLSA